MVMAVRRTGIRLLVALALMAAGAGTAALVAPGGAAAPSPCNEGQTVTTECTSTEPPPTDTTTTTTTPTPTTTTPTTTTPTPTTTTPTTTTPTPTTPTTPTPTPTPPTESIPTVTVPDAGTGSVEKPKQKPTKPAQPRQRPAPVAPLHTGPTDLTPDLGPGTYVFPVYGPVLFTDAYGVRRSTGWHHGDEIFAPLGAPVLAVTDGTLFLVSWSPVGGNRLWLRDDNGNYFYYAHLAAFSTAAAQGVRVHAGQIIGFVGDTGEAAGTPPHLHFEIHPVSRIAYGYDGAVSPTPYLRAWQRLQRLQFTASDLALTTLTGWSAAMAAPSAPSPGAILLSSSDITTATSLDKRAVRRALATSSSRTRPWALRKVLERRSHPTPFKISPKQRRHALQAERLDIEASLPPGFPGSSVWDQLAQCEAGGDWAAENGDGFYGGLQFTSSTWLENGGGVYAQYANNATREEQIAIAKRVLAIYGWVAWPVCSQKLGLR
jgi:murein DD-endopeptidase MepM/ murein hydrolase activator NlpD